MSEVTSTFRSPVEKSTPAPKTDAPIADVGSPIDTKIPQLLATYSEDQGKPYIAEYLELDGVWDQDKTLKTEINTIEGYLKEQIKLGKLENNVKSGQKYLRELEKRAETNPYESTTNRISKLLAYIEFQRVVHG